MTLRQCLRDLLFDVLKPSSDRHLRLSPGSHDKGYSSCVSVVADEKTGVELINYSKY